MRPIIIEGNKKIAIEIKYRSIGQFSYGNPAFYSTVIGQLLGALYQYKPDELWLITNTVYRSIYAPIINILGIKILVFDIGRNEIKESSFEKYDKLEYKNVTAGIDKFTYFRFQELIQLLKTTQSQFVRKAIIEKMNQYKSGKVRDG